MGKNKKITAQIYIELQSGEEYNIEAICSNESEYRDLERTINNFTTGTLNLKNAVSSATIKGTKRSASISKK